jgi:hypothetical protein
VVFVLVAVLAVVVVDVVLIIVDDVLVIVLVVVVLLPLVNLHIVHYLALFLVLVDIDYQVPVHMPLDRRHTVEDKATTILQKPLRSLNALPLRDRSAP